MENEELSSHVHSGVSETQTGAKIPAVALAKVSAALESLCTGFAGCSCVGLVASAGSAGGWATGAAARPAC